MFKKWLENNDIGKIDFGTPLFPKASDREFWDSKYNRTVIDLAEGYLGYSWPTIKATDFMEYLRTGDRLKQESVLLPRRQALLTLVVAEILEHKGRFTDEIVNGIFTTCEETYWGFSAHRDPIGENDNIPPATRHYIDLLVGDTAEMLSLTYYILYDELEDRCPEILARMEYELERRVIKPYLEHTDFWWMGYNRTPNNWNPWILSNIFTVFLTVEKRKTVFNAGIKKLLVEINRYYTVMPEDGGCDEGCGYWSLAGAMLFEFCEQLYVSTSGKVNMFDDEKLKNIIRYFYRAHIGGNWFVNFADAPPKINSASVPYILYMSGLRTNDSNLSAFSKVADKLNTRPADVFSTHNLKRALGAYIYIEEFAKQGEFVPEDKYVLPDLQVSFLRSGDWYYAAKGGHNDESHNHNDIGNFIAFCDNQPVLVDPGCGMYTKKTFSEFRYEIWTMQSGWHCVPVINGIEQQYGRRFCADSFEVSDKRTEVEFRSAYPESAGLEQIKRTIDFDNGVVIKDELCFKDNDNSVVEHFITPHEVKIEGDCAVIDGRFRLQAEGGKASVDSVSFDGDSKLIGHWGTDKINRIKFEFSVGKCVQITATLRRV